MKKSPVSSIDIARKLVVNNLQEYDKLLQKKKLSPADLKNLRRLREAARIAKSLGC